MVPFPLPEAQKHIQPTQSLQCSDHREGEESQLASVPWDLVGFGEGHFLKLICPARLGMPQFPDVSSCLWSECWMGLGKTQIVSSWPTVGQATGTF